MKIRDGFALVLALGLGLAGCASGGGGGAAGGGGGGGGGAGNILAQGERPRETGDTRVAARHLDAAEDADTPEEARPHYQQALTAAEAAIAEDATNPLAYRLAGFAAVGAEDYEAAGDYFDRAEELRPIYELELSPIREQVYLERYQESTPSLQSGDYEAAAVYLEQANAVYSGRPEAAITLAQIYAQLRDHDRALARIDDAMAFYESDAMADVDPETAAAWQEQGEGLELMRAQVLVDAGRMEEAVTAYRALVADDPSNVSLTQDLAAILMQTGQTDDAMTVYESLLSRSDLASQDFYRIGIGLYQNSDYGRAADAFERAAQGSRMDRDALEMWARSLQLDSAYAAVPPVAERWMELDPASQIAITVLAQAVNATGDSQRAGEIIGQVDQLPIAVGDLQMRRYDGGAQVSGSVSNKSLAQGSSVTLTFTFYGESGAQIGTATQQVTVGAQDMSETFQFDYQSAQPVGGYGYTYTTG